MTRTFSDTLIGQSLHSEARFVINLEVGTPEGTV